jgi:hypothetical protein
MNAGVRLSIYSFEVRKQEEKGRMRAYNERIVLVWLLLARDGHVVESVQNGSLPAVFVLKHSVMVDILIRLFPQGT